MKKVLISNKQIEFRKLKRYLMDDNKLNERAIKIKQQYNEGLSEYYLDQVKITLAFEDGKRIPFTLEHESFERYLSEVGKRYMSKLSREMNTKCLSTFGVDKIDGKVQLKVKIEFILKTLDWGFYDIVITTKIRRNVKCF